MPSDRSYVITAPLGSATFDLDEICDSVAARNPDANAVIEEDAGGDFWPRVPDHFKPPPAHLEDAVREVDYIKQWLIRPPTPTNASELECYSDMILSLETRTDLTNLVLKFTEIENALIRVGRLKLEDDSHNLAKRANSLKRHWGDIRNAALKGTREDLVFPPFVATLPAGKPPGWKLELSDKATEEAEKLYAAKKSQLDYGGSYFSVNPPRPIGWVPLNDKAWSQTNRAKIDAGDLFHSKNWSPIYESFGLACIDMTFAKWEHPAWDEEQKLSHKELKQYSRDWSQNINDIEIQKLDILKDEDKE